MRVATSTLRVPRLASSSVAPMSGSDGVLDDAGIADDELLKTLVARSAEIGRWLPPMGRRLEDVPRRMRVDTREDVGDVVDGVDAVSSAARDEGVEDREIVPPSSLPTKRMLFRPCRPPHSHKNWLFNWLDGTDRRHPLDRRDLDCARHQPPGVVRRRNSARGPANAKGWTCQTAAAEYRSVIDLLRNVVAAVRRFFAPHAIVAAENLLLRRQLIVLRRSSPRPRLQRLDRWLIATLATRTHSLLEAVIVVRPATVLRWHRAAWRLWWRLALDPSGRPAADRRRVEDPHPAYVAREPPVGREPDCRRARTARLARLAAHGRQVSPEALGAWPRAGLGDLSPEPCLAGLGLRLVHGGHRALPDALRVRRRLPRAPQDRPRGC